MFGSAPPAWNAALPLAGSGDPDRATMRARLEDACSCSGSNRRSAAGVRAYSLDACIAGYRLGITRTALVLLGLSEHGMLTPAHADRALTAYRDAGVSVP